MLKNYIITQIRGIHVHSLFLPLTVCNIIQAFRNLDFVFEYADHICNNNNEVYLLRFADIRVSVRSLTEFCLFDEVDPRVGEIEEPTSWP